MSTPDLTDLLADIRLQHRQRVFAMDQRKRLDLALGSFLRMALGWQRELPEDERRAIATAAKKLMDADSPDGEWAGVILASRAARAPFIAIQTSTTRTMEKLAKQLPVWHAWAGNVRGFGARSLATIVAEAGDLADYPKKGHLWKRMGLAVIDGVRQGGLTKAASRVYWIEHGYNANRRARMFVIGDCLVKQGAEYRQVYLDRKLVERAKAEALGLMVAPAAKIPAKRAAEFVSDGIIHRRAQRYMEKRLLLHLWQAWNGRRAIHGLPNEASGRMPSAQPLEMHGAAP